jgi:apolipoprotein N-acyltransferase
MSWPSPFAVAICYEISDGRALAKATAQGAEWLLTIANLDPYPQLLQRQFLALAQLRAIETGRDVLSVANTGPTALVSADGTVQRLLEPQTDAVAAAELQRRQQLTGYSRLVWAWSSR